MDDRQYHLTLLAKNNQGYKNLVKLATQAQLEGFYYKPRADYELLEQYHEGLICLSGCPAGEIPRALRDGNEEKARELALLYRDLFGADNFYIEIQDHGMDWEQEVTGKLVKLASETSTCRWLPRTTGTTPAVRMPRPTTCSCVSRRTVT